MLRWLRRISRLGSFAAWPPPAVRRPDIPRRRLPAPIIADALNYNLRFTRDVDEVGLLASLGEDNAVGVPTGTLRAATGPHYGRCGTPMSSPC